MQDNSDLEHEAISELVARIIDLYHEITEQALKNETRPDHG